VTSAPTLDEIKTWPATISVADAARAFGISKSHAYALIAYGQFPARILSVGGVRRVVTSSVVALLAEAT
jgi:predicted DNA-binding transcriptional regulator AlpA